MAKKYLSLEEAAAKLGVSEDAIKKARESGSLRGFADRGNWKFRDEDVEEYGRTLQIDSSPDVPLLAGDQKSPASRSVFADDDDDIGEQPTVIRKAGEQSVLDDDEGDLPFDLGSSDSDVRLVLDADLTARDDKSDATASTLPDADQEIPVSFGDSSKEIELADSSGDEEGSSSVDIPISFGDSSQEMALALDDEDSSGDAPLGLDDSDSDVRLASAATDQDLEDSSREILLASDASDSDVRLAGVDDERAKSARNALVSDDSDSDVRLLDRSEPVRLDLGSDSDVRLIKTDSDSDVKLVSSTSDSDVRLLPPDKSSLPDSDSDVKLAGTDGDLPLAIADSADEDLSSDSVLTIGAGSDISLEPDSGISLETGDSGISLDLAADSGIALDAGTDSDISLAIGTGDDEGITLDTTSDSGIALDLPDDSGLSLDSPSMEATVPLMKTDGKGKGKPAKGKTPQKRDESETMVQIPSAKGKDSSESDTDFEPGTLEGESTTSDTSVLLFDDEDETDDRAATMVKKREAEPEEAFDVDASEAFGEEVEEELAGEDDELEDVGEDFMADEGDFEESFATGESAAEFTAPVGARLAPVEQEWGGGVFAMVLVSTVGMILCAGVMFDLVRYVWKAGEYGAVAGPLINMIGIK